MLPAMAPFSLIYSVFMCEVNDDSQPMSQTRLRRYFPAIHLIRRVIMVRGPPLYRLLRRLRAGIGHIITRIGLVAAFRASFRSSDRVALPPPFAFEFSLRVAFFV